ncbi:MAG: hypothetical protein LUE92_01925 [Clostridiales bacterium]|nr:hypothetical protein [Clostridiales bacterium]
MGDLKRVYLKSGHRIMLSDCAEGGSPKSYRVRKVMGEGGSTICYEAVRESDGKIGILKEFYPLSAVEGDDRWLYSLRRQEDGQLAVEGNYQSKFDKMRDEYLEVYSLLNKVMQENPDSQLLKNYIQSGEILYGCSDESLIRKTVYIWYAGTFGIGLDEYLIEVRKEPWEKSGYRLNDILQMMIALTDFVKALHTVGLMHLDIKPSNFFVPYNSDLGISAAKIEAIDINTVYSIKSDVPRIVGTDGYRAPEVVKGRADNRSDIYSIGAMLFHAIVISKEIPDGLYCDLYYPELNRLVRYSELIADSELTSDSMLLSRLVRILQKCLARNPRARYRSCMELLKDLRKAEVRSKQYAVSAELIGQNKKLKIIEKDEKGINDPSVVIQKMLCDHPLYEMPRTDMGEINVMVIGSGNYSQKFMDLCLQTGQMKDCSLSIAAFSSSPEEDREVYLQFRPDISRFVNVNGSLKESGGQVYAVLDFLPLLGRETGNEDLLPEFRQAKSEQIREENYRLACAIMDHMLAVRHTCDYIFIALGNDQFNHTVAKLFAEISLKREKAGKCPVCYISEKIRKSRGQNKERLLYPICINERIMPDVELDRMACNTHLSWCSSLNLDVNDTLNQFRGDKYNYSSSFAFALSVWYKLASIGIRTKDPMEAAAVFTEEILKRKDNDAEAKKKFDTLVALEHRRWILSLVTEGWKAPRDLFGRLNLESCVWEGKVKNSVKRTHPCIVFSTEATPLKGEEYTADGRAKWDDPEIDPQLDELDRMSVALHQCFRKRADEFRKENPLQGEDLEAIRQLIANGDRKVERTFRQFQFCLKNILNGVESYSKQYGYYERSFQDTLSVLDGETRSNIENRLSLISRAFFPVIEANLYRNYKAYDEVLIEKIPFILTYHFQPSLALAFEDGKRENGRNEAVFANVAAATVLSPERICYLYYFDQKSRTELLGRKISAVINYLDKRNVHCIVTMAIACRQDLSEQKKEGLRKTLDRLKNGVNDGKKAVFENYAIMNCVDEDGAAEVLSEYLDNNRPALYDGSTVLFSSALENSRFVEGILHHGIPYFEFEWRDKRFTRHINCDELSYIRENSCIRINDMFSLMNAVNNKFSLPEFAEDYETLWDIYTGSYLPDGCFEKGVDTWNDLCRILGNYEKNREPLAVIPRNRTPMQGIKTMVYLLPAYAQKTVKDILFKLAEYQVVRADSGVAGYTSENCRVEIKADASLETIFNRLFSKPHFLMGYYSIDVSVRPEDDFAVVRYDDLNVSCVDLDPEKTGRQESGYALLRKLQETHFITGLSLNADHPSRISFAYISPRIKKLLTSAGEILKIYTYYQVLKTGYFDDVACGYEFDWEKDGVKSELDLVLTKGFRSIIVECKAVEKLDVEYYHKLYSIAEHFGIGTIKVLVGNTCEKNDRGVLELNQVQRSRGNQMNIVTIFGEESIRNIGEVLVRMMEA